MDNNTISSDDNTIEVNEANDETILADDEVGNFTSLASEISNTDEGDTLELTRDYTYNSTTDSSSGITISKSMTIDGKGYTISGNKAVKIFTVTGSNVILKNIKFTSGYTFYGYGGAIYWSGTNGTIDNCTFTNNTIWGGGAIYWNGANGTIKSSTFENNNATVLKGGAIMAVNSLNVTGCYFNNNFGAYGGGAIFMQNTNGYITDCVFKNSNSTYITSDYYYPNTFGGAIWIQGGSSYNCYINNCSFENNTATNGSSVYAETNLTISNCTFNDAPNYFTNISKALKTTQDLYLSDNTFNNDNFIESEGTISSPVTVAFTASPTYANIGDDITITGTITDDNSNPIVLSDIEFVTNTNETFNATFDSSFVFTATYSSSSEANVTISANVTDILTSASANTVDVIFEEKYPNFSTLAKEIQYCTDDTYYLTQNYTYSSSKDSDYSSGIVIDKEITIDGQGYTLNGNTLARIFNITSDNVVLKNIILTKGYSKEDGGAVYSDCEITVENCTFTYNDADNGGAVYSAGGNIYNSTFTNNDATTSGGAVYYSARGEIENSEFTTNTAVQNGGAIYFEKKSSIYYSTLTGNEVSSNNGGGVYFKNTGYIINCSLISNTAENNGGGAFFKDKTGYIINSTFTGNSAKKGGAVIIKVSCEITNSIFTNNTSTKKDQGGGAVYLELENGTGSISDCEFVNNYAKGYGGAVYAELSEATITNSIFTDNTAKENGGAIYLENGGNITGSTLTDNAAASGVGSGILLSDGDFYLQDNTLTNNVIYLFRGNLTSQATAVLLNGTTVTSSLNTETTLTGTVYDDNSNIIILTSIDFLINNNETVTGTFDSTGVFSGSYTPTSTGDYTISVNETDQLSDLTITTGTLTVGKEILNITIEIEDAVYPYATVIVNSVEDGVYNVSIGNTETTITVSGNTGNKTLSGIASGNNTVTVVFEGDEYYAKSTASKTFTEAKANNTLSISISDVTYPNQAVAKIEASADGLYILTVNDTDYNVTVSNNAGEVTLNVLSVSNDEYSAVLTFTNTNYTSLENSTTFKVNAGNLTPSITVYNYGVNATIVVVIGTSATGNVTLSSENYNATNSLENGQTTFTIPDLSTGSYNITISYSGDDNYNASSVTSTITMHSSITSSDIKCSYSSKTKFSAIFYNSDGSLLANTTVVFKIGDKTYNETTDANGVGTLNSNLAIGTYTITSINPYTGEQVNNTFTIVKTIQSNSNVNMFYLDGSTYKVRVYGNNGNIISGATVTFKINKVTYKRTTNSAGWAILKLNIKKLVPKSYRITASYSGYTVKNTVKVKQIIKAKKTTNVKRTAKRLIIKIKLKGKTVLKKKTLKVKFRGKTYKIKTNKKGIAQFKLTKKVIKKLKRGKRYTYAITYQKDTLKRYIKVKK